MKTINWGIIGLGKIAQKFARDLKLVEGSKLYAVASRSQEKADQFGQLFEVENCYDSYEKLARDPNIHAVYIATPHVRHAMDSMLCLNQGKAVLCEKPFGMNAREVELILDTAQSNKVLVMEALWTRIMPHFKFVMDEIRSGKYGKVKTLTADFCFQAPYDPLGRLFDKMLGGGALLDVGIYPVFCALAILGKPESISAKAKIGKTGADEDNEITLLYPGDTKAHLSSSIVRNTPTTATLICEKGMIFIHSRFHHTDKVTTVLNGVQKEHDFNYQGQGYYFEAEHFADLIRNGKIESPLMSYEFSRLIIQTLDDIRKDIDLEYDPS